MRFWSGVPLKAFSHSPSGRGGFLFHRISSSNNRCDFFSALFPYRFFLPLLESAARFFPSRRRKRKGPIPEPWNRGLSSTLTHPPVEPRLQKGSLVGCSTSLPSNSESASRAVPARKIETFQSVLRARALFPLAQPLRSHGSFFPDCSSS